MLPMLRKKPPPRRALIVEAIRLGVDTSARVADLFGIPHRQASAVLWDLEHAKRIRRGPILRTGEMGPPRQTWRAL